MAPKKILIPLDGSELAERILVHVQRLLLSEDAEAILLHALPEKVAGAVYPPGENALALARRRIEALRDALVANGATATARVVLGDPATRILEAARQLDAGLIAMSTHGRSGLSRLARGSVAERVLRRATTPVLLANPLALPERQPLRMKRILVPLDGSEMSAEVLPLAGDLAKTFEAEVVLLHVLETIVAPDPFVVVSPGMTREEAAALLDGFARRVAAPVRVRVVVGAAAASILDVAKEEKPDLIAMTTHGRSGLSRWAFGSVAEHVVRHAPCPLLVKRTAGFLEDAGSPSAAASDRRDATPAAAGAHERA